MKFIAHRSRQRARADDSGMTLIEVIVAISLVAIISTGVIGLGITSQKGASSQQRQELAVTIASEAMEAANAQSSATNPTTRMSYLYQGRTFDDVRVAWDANLGVPGLAQTHKGWDPAAIATSPQALPVKKTVTRSGTEYTVYTLIGTCYISTTAGGGNCARLAGEITTPPAAPPTGQTPLSRVIVVVRWNAGAGCAASGCSYYSSSLVDAHSDLQWNTHD